ncbi:MAG TPA: transcription termination factor NusA [Vicinamibacteria bacterium]|nr:transcription termination factor NusA [Vicinamibacteria bacterium]
MNSELFHAIEQIGREKGIDVEIVIDAVKDAVVAASKKHFHTREELDAEFNKERGTYDVFALKKVVDEVADSDLEISIVEARKYNPLAEIDSILRLPKPRVDLGRIAAQAAKQVIYQKVREAERENVFREYSDRVGEVVNGVVKRFERGDIILDLGKTESILPRREQSRAEHYNQGDRIRAVIVNVDKSAKGPQITVSRTDTRLLMKLFEMEVPEIYDGTVIIESIARDPGDRAKVAVRSKEKDVDPVGACVGIKGSRVQAIIRELRGEKIDIVQWSDDPTLFVGNALNPAKIGRVSLVDEANRRLEITVDDSQLSQAIGKKGQNVRLASQLIGWNIDIKSESEKKREIEEEMARVQRGTREIKALPGVGEKTIQKLLDAGYRSLEELVQAGLGILCEVEGVGEKIAQKILDAASEGITRRQAAEAEEARLAAEAAAEQARLAAEAEAAERAHALEAAEGGGDDAAAETESGEPGQADSDYTDAEPGGEASASEDASASEIDEGSPDEPMENAEEVETADGTAVKQ